MGVFKKLFGRPSEGAPSAGAQQDQTGPGPASHSGSPAERAQAWPRRPDAELPRLTIVILNYNGQHHFPGCFGSLSKLDWPKEKLEVLLIDNGSSDGSVETLRRDWPWVRTLANPKNLGFSAGCNQGAREADRAEVLVFLNNDMRVEPGFLRALVEPLLMGEAQAVTAKMLSWDGKRIDSAGGGMNFHGIGIQKGYQESPAAIHDQRAPSLFACGGAMAIGAELFREVGGFDEEFFAYYEDVDLGWRLWVQGHRILYEPRAVCYHHHSSTSKTFPAETIRVLQVRNPVLACFKNYDDEHLKAVLPALLALYLRRMWIGAGLHDAPGFRIEQTEAQARGVVGRLVDKAKHAMHDSVPISRIAAADLVGINDLLGRYDHWMGRRRAVQARRKRSDAEIFALFHKPMWCIEEEPAYKELHQGLTGFLGLDRWFEGLEGRGRDPRG